MFYPLPLSQEYLEDQKYSDEEDLAEKLEGFKSKKIQPFLQLMAICGGVAGVFPGFCLSLNIFLLSRQYTHTHTHTQSFSLQHFVFLCGKDRML